MDLLLKVILSAIVTMVLIEIVAFMIYGIYRLLNPHNCTIRIKRENGQQIIQARFRFKKDKDGNQLVKTTGGRFKQELPMPKEGFFGFISRRKLFADIMVPDNGKPYFIKPDIDKLAEKVVYYILDRDVLAESKQKLRQLHKRFTWSSNLDKMAPIAGILIILISIILGLYYITKQSANAMDKISEIDKDRMIIMERHTRAMTNLTIAINGLMGTSSTPIVLNKNPTTGPGGTG